MTGAVAAPGGYIFGCTDETIDECLGTCLFGLPMNHWNNVRLIEAGTPLFLFVFTTRELFGGFYAAGSGGIDIVPSAFDWRFPCQVKVKRRRVVKEVLTEADFYHILRDNYYEGKKFRFWLTKEQVDNLNMLFGLVVRKKHPRALHSTQRKKVRQKRRRVDDTPGNFSGKSSDLQLGKPSHKMSLRDLHEMFSLSICEAMNVSRMQDGIETRTTVAIGPLPGQSDMDVEMIVHCLDKSHMGKYNFLYSRWMMSTRYCFMNLTKPQDVLTLAQRLDGKKWGEVFSERMNEDKTIKVVFWRLQGIVDLAKKFKGEGFWYSGGASTCKELYDNRPLFFYGAGARFASRAVILPRNENQKERGVSPLSAFLNGWPKLLETESYELHQGFESNIIELSESDVEVINLT